jgi:23S rRNA (cytidine1920-2'-O)/16S rRNA (cytidine1409-2'-O)-methyltransferase
VTFVAGSRPPASERKTRLDALLVDRGLAESRSLAQRLIMAGEVRIDGQVALKPGRLVDRQASLEVAAQPRFVSRGGEKLKAALDSFGLGVQDAVCADVGASTGGFTDCLLQHGARRVVAIDVGHGILHWRLRQDPRVVLLEDTNARYLEALPEPVDWVTIDASFISLTLILPVVVRWLKPGGGVVALVKPQFEAGRRSVGRGGVVRDPEVHRRVLEGVIAALGPLGLEPRGLIRSPLVGPKGNVEFLLWAGQRGGAEADAGGLIEAILPPPV